MKYLFILFLVLSLPTLSFAMNSASQMVLEIIGEKVSITGRVHFGLVRNFDPAKGELVAVVDSKKIFPKTPAYKRIIDKGIDKESALGKKLLLESYNDMLKAVKSLAIGKYVLVVEKGGISDYPTTNITKLVIDALPNTITGR